MNGNEDFNINLRKNNFMIKNIDEQDDLEYYDNENDMDENGNNIPINKLFLIDQYEDKKQYSGRGMVNRNLSNKNLSSKNNVNNTNSAKK
jgi:hypothetical protein